MLLVALLSSVSLHAQQQFPYQAVIRIPVVDMSNSYPMPHAPAASGGNCHRAHQGLFNEIVTCVAQRKDQVHVACNNIAYGVEEGKALNTFWVRKKYLTPIKALDKQLREALPTQSYGEQPTVVLIHPWQEFSIGTRFVHHKQQDTTHHYAVLIPQYDTGIVEAARIPQQYALQELPRTTEQKRKLFVSLINHISDYIAQRGADTCIPYVWGGSSCTTWYKKSDFFMQNGAWHATESNRPYSGYDCSGFIMRMAKIAGINFPWKTSVCIRNFCKDLAPAETLEAGDIIWIPGHVMLVSDIAQHELIEARGYQSGFGYMQRIPLTQAFKDIATYNQLIEKYRTKKPITQLDRAGAPWGTPALCKLLKLL